MYAVATSRGTRFVRSPRAGRRGSALFACVVVGVGLIGLVYAATRTTVVEVDESRHGLEEVRTEYIAEAGVERAMAFLNQAVRNTNAQDPLRGLNDLFAGGDVATPFPGVPMMDNGAQVGAYAVRLRRVASDATSITIAIDASGYTPDAPASLPAGQQPRTWSSVTTTVRYALAPSHVFDYAYFINNWGWFYGSTINCRGSARSNGQFDAGGYAPTLTGQPQYDAVSWNGTNANLTGYQDDNHDGQADGNDGGVWAAWDIVNAGNMQGNGGHAQNQHEFDDPIEMPNLTDLSQYEATATAAHASITVNGVEMCDAVYGDEAGELQNIYLVGTAEQPIVLNGPVVVRGNVVISGYVTGQGAIYSGGNVYCPNSVRYVNGPTTPRPADNTEAATETWLAANWNKDFLGLFARENVVVGDFTNSTWRSYTSRWMGDALNQSAEDAGIDGIPNTRDGRDGVHGTADDDVLEGDGVFTVERYTAQDEALGLIPAGKSVGDIIPGSGEDIDGDGIYDGTTSMSNVTMAMPLTNATWGGNVPSGGIATYSSIASMNANRLDATFYTNHSFCWVVLGSETARINGSLVCRNENIIYGTPTLDFNYDCRLLGGNTGRAAGLLPRTVQPPQILRWAHLDTDPNRAVTP